MVLVMLGDLESVPQHESRLIPPPRLSREKGERMKGSDVNLEASMIIGALPAAIVIVINY